MKRFVVSSLGQGSTLGRKEENNRRGRKKKKIGGRGEPRGSLGRGKPGPRLVVSESRLQDQLAHF